MNKIIDFFFDEDEIEVKENYKNLGIVAAISFVVSIIAIVL